MEQKTKATTLKAPSMSKRILDREDNIYRMETIRKVIDMYMEECRKALIKGERIQIKGVGTIIPEVKVRKTYGLSFCNKPEGNPPYTALRLYRNNYLKYDMDGQLRKNVKDEIYGLEAVPFAPQQMRLLKKTGYVPEDVEIESDRCVYDDDGVEECNDIEGRVMDIDQI